MQPNPSNQTRIGRIFFIYSRMDCTGQMEVCRQSRSRWPSSTYRYCLSPGMRRVVHLRRITFFSLLGQMRKSERIARFRSDKKNNWLQKSKLTSSKTKCVTSRTGDSRAETWASPISENSSCCTLRLSRSVPLKFNRGVEVR